MKDQLLRSSNWGQINRLRVPPGQHGTHPILPTSLAERLASILGHSPWARCWWHCPKISAICGHPSPNHAFDRKQGSVRKRYCSLWMEKEWRSRVRESWPNMYVNRALISLRSRALVFSAKEQSMEPTSHSAEPSKQASRGYMNCALEREQMRIPLTVASLQMIFDLALFRIKLISSAS